MKDNESNIVSKLLDMASDEFSNHGCNDLDKEIESLITAELLEEIRVWNDAEDTWPEHASQIGDATLMRYMAYKFARPTPPPVINN